MLHHFQGRIDIGTGNGGIISQLKMQNEMKLTDESWISYQQGKGNEEYPCIFIKAICNVSLSTLIKT